MKSLLHIGIGLLILASFMILGLIGFSVAHADTTPATLYCHLKLTWSPVTTDVTGAPLSPAVTTYNVWVDTQPIPDTPAAPPTVSVVGSLTTANVYPQVPTGSTLYARVNAQNGTTAANTSVLSGQVSIAAGSVTTTPPTGPVIVVAPASPTGVNATISYTTTPPAN